MWTVQNKDADFTEIGRIFLRHSDSISRANQRYAAARRGFAASLKQLREAQARRAQEGISELDTSDTIDAANPPATPIPAETMSTDEAAETLNPKLVSLLIFPETAELPITGAQDNGETPAPDPENPPIAA